MSRTKEEIKEYKRKWNKKNKDKIAKERKEYAKKNKRKILKYQKHYREKNKDKIKEYDSKYRNKNKEKLNKYHREWCNNNLERVKQYEKKLTKSRKKDRKKKKNIRYNTRYKEQYKLYYVKNGEKIRERKRLWRIRNKERENKNQKVYHKKRMKSDVGYRIKYYLHKRFREAINKNQKKGIVINLLGCSIIEFKEYLQSMFTYGMNWNNYGVNGWHIDHIIPCAVFDLSKKEAQEFCFHCSNLQPMWGDENMKKNSKVDIELLRKLDRNILKEKYIKLLDSTV